MSGVIVHEWLERVGGAEKVLDAILEVFPGEDLFCLWNDAPERYSGRRVHESWIARTPLRRSKAASLPFMIPTWRGLRGKPYDWAVVSSHLFAHQVTFKNTSPDFRQFVYVHTPARYIWTPELDARGDGLLGRLTAPTLRHIDKRRAQGSGDLAANSEYVRERILRTWERDARVIYPPVNTERIASVSDWSAELDAADAAVLEGLPDQFVLGASRLVPYKGLDTVIDVGAVMDLPVVVAGSGPDEERLRSRAAESKTPTIFIPAPSDALLFALYQACTVYVFPPVEDFGIMPVEAVAAGAKVLVNFQGGAAESAHLTGGGASVANWHSPADIREGFAAAIAATGGGSASTSIFSKQTFQARIRDWVGEIG